MPIAYHGTPITSAGNIVLETLGARDYCVPFWRDDQIEWIDANARSYFGDNSVYSMWQAALKQAKANGTSFDGVTYSQADYDRFVAWARRWCLEGRCSWVVIPDPIGTSTQELDALIREWPSDLKPFGVPVWHTEEPIDRAVRLLDQHGRLCVGAVGEHAVVGSSAFEARIDDLWNAIFRFFGHAEDLWVHMFRALQLLLPKWIWPFRSYDSADLGRNHARLKAYGERRLWAVKQKADRWDRMAANKSTLWIPPHLRNPGLFGEAA